MDYHVRMMKGRPNYGEITNRKVQVIMHFPVPAGNNDAGVAWQACVVADDFITKDTVLVAGEITPAEITQIQNGEVIEEVREVTVWEDDTAVAMRDKIDAAYTTRKLEITQELGRRYKYWGYSRDIP